MVARRAHNPKVVGSNPASATKKIPRTRSEDIFLPFHSSLIKVILNNDNNEMIKVGIKDLIAFAWKPIIL